MDWKIENIRNNVQGFFMADIFTVTLEKEKQDGIIGVPVNELEMG